MSSNIKSTLTCSIAQFFLSTTKTYLYSKVWYEVLLFRIRISFTVTDQGLVLQDCVDACKQGQQHCAVQDANYPLNPYCFWDLFAVCTALHRCGT